MNLFISVGHSGGRVGATAYGTTEFTECAKIARSVEQILRPVLGTSLYMVPTEFDIIPRTAYINAQSLPGDIAIELHMDSGTDRSTGCGVYYRSQTERQGAMKLMSVYREKIGIPIRFTEDHTKSRFGRLGIVADSRPNTMLIELGFITNRKELDTMREKSAQAIADALISTFFPTHTAHVSLWAEESVKKATKKGIMTQWATPRTPMTDELWQHVFKNFGVLEVVDPTQPLTKERVAVLLDRLGLLS